MDALSLFGLFAVTAMVVAYALESRSIGSCWLLREPAFSARSTAFCRARGHSAWWKRYGRQSHSGDGCSYRLPADRTCTLPISQPSGAFETQVKHRAKQRDNANNGKGSGLL